MKLAESVSAARGTLKMARVMRVIPGVRTVTVFLTLSLSRLLAAGWEDGVVLEDGHDPAGTVFMNQESPVQTPDSSLFQGIPSEAENWSGAMVADGGPTHPLDCGGACCHANWTFRADALLLWRNAPASRPIYSTIVPGTNELGPTVLNANNLNSDVLAAPRLSLLRTNRDGQTFETTYLYAGNFFSERALSFSADGYATSPPGIYGNNWGPATDTSLDSATATLLGQLQSLEFNIRHCIWADTCQFLIGARWLQWNESLQMTDYFSKMTSTGFVNGTDFYDTRCFNNLWGGQLGLDTLLLGGPGTTRLEGLVKAGAYYNAAGQASTFRYTQSNGYTYDNQAQAGGPAACSFVGELGLTAVLPISCNCDLRCGYFGLWLTNLAQPTRQLSNQTINQFSSVAGLDAAGAVIVQGLSLGLESRW